MDTLKQKQFWTFAVFVNTKGLEVKTIEYLMAYLLSYDYCCLHLL